jgi:hypothetical protein
MDVDAAGHRNEAVRVDCLVGFAAVTRRRDDRISSRWLAGSTICAPLM